MIAQKMFEKLDAQLSVEDLDHATMFFDFNLSTEASLFEQWGAEVAEGQASDLVLPHLMHMDMHIGYGDIFKDWAVQTLKRKETYLYLAMVLFASVIFGRITTAVIEEERLALQDLPNMEKTPEPTPEPTPPPTQDTPEPTPPPKEEEEEPEPTPPPKDIMEEEKLEDLAKDEQLEDLKRDEILKDQIRDNLAFEKLAARPADKGSTGVISRKFADTTKRSRDNVNLDLKNVGAGKSKKDTGGAKPQLGSIGSKGKAKDTGAETLQSMKKDTSSKPKTKSDKSTVGKVNWIKLPGIGQVAHLQPRCLGVKGFVVVGDFRLLCANDQIVSAWKKQ